jgi:LysM repeat protein
VLLLGVAAGVFLLVVSPTLPNERERTAAAPPVPATPRPAAVQSSRPAAVGTVAPIAPAAPDSSPAPSPAPSPSAVPARKHVIKSGDTLLAIAAQYDTTVDALRAANPGLNETALRVGEEITIPPR